MPDVEEKVLAGRLKRPGFVRRADVQADRRTLWVYGDNMERRGKGGQAEEMRGEPNTVGIPVKRAPRWDEDAFFTEEDGKNPRVRQAIRSAFDAIRSALIEGRDVAIPVDGIGTGRAQLQTRAPRLLAQIEAAVAGLAEIARPVEPLRNKDGTLLPAPGSTWVARDGRVMRLEQWIEYRAAPTALMTVLNCTKGMRRRSEQALDGFGTFLVEMAPAAQSTAAAPSQPGFQFETGDHTPAGPTEAHPGFPNL